MVQSLFQVLGQTQDHRHRVLVAAARNIKIWFIKVRKIKAIYYTLNMLNLDVTQKCLIAECWCPVQDLDRIQQALRGGTVCITTGGVGVVGVEVGGGHVLFTDIESAFYSLFIETIYTDFDISDVYRL